MGLSPDQLVQHLGDGVEPHLYPFHALDSLDDVVVEDVDLSVASFEDFGRIPRDEVVLLGPQHDHSFDPRQALFL